MAIKYYKPTTQVRRGMSVVDYSFLAKKKSEKSLTMPFKRQFGRDNKGHISVRHKGAGAKRLYRLVSNLEKQMDKPAKMESLEYDPNRNAFIALLKYANGEKIYILAPEGLKIGQEIIASEKVEIKPGNRAKLKNIPSGIAIHDIELIPDRGRGQIARTAGSAATVAALAEGIGKRAKYVQVKLPSGEIRLIHGECFASIGRVSNADHASIRIGKAGRKRQMGIRPTVRGKAMHPAAHPHGGGEGVNPIGLKHPKTPWGKPALGYKTRKKKYSDKFIIKRRK